MFVLLLIWSQEPCVLTVILDSVLQRTWHTAEFNKYQMNEWYNPENISCQMNKLKWLNSEPAHTHKRPAEIKTLFCSKSESRASLVVQWLRICLPMQETRVRALVWEDPTCRGATRPMSHNYWACASEACAQQQERPRQWEARAPRWWVAPARCN